MMQEEGQSDIYGWQENIALRLTILLRLASTLLNSEGFYVLLLDHEK